MGKGVQKRIASEVVGAAVENGFIALATIAGFPELALSIPLAKGLVLGLVENCFNDCSQMTLSIREKSKLERVSLVALSTFRELSEKDGREAWATSIDPAYYDYAFEVAEHATLEAIRQSEIRKVDILGWYYGKQLYKGNLEWQDMHQIITMTSMLTFRQLSLIRLISEGFRGIDHKLFISNPSACVEINRLKDYGIWQTQGAAFGINESWPLQLESIIPTIYSDRVNEELMLDHISEEEIQRTIDSLLLVAEGTPQTELTEDEFRRRTDFSVEGNTLVLPGGRKIMTEGEMDEMYLRDLARGK